MWQDEGDTYQCHGGGARRTKPRFSDNSPYLNRRQHARKVGDPVNNVTGTATTEPPPPPRAQAHIIVGVAPGEVVATAATYADRFDADLICVHVDDFRYTVEIRSDGSVVSIPIDPDLVAEAAPEFDPLLHSAIAEVLRGSSVNWTLKTLAGSASQELASLAEEVDAQMIVVGVRKAGIKGSFHEFFNGSVAIQLAQHQHRPLLVVPLASDPAVGPSYPEVGASGPEIAGGGEQ
nr:universal stress protein [Brevibacterium sp. ZH18]